MRKSAKRDAIIEAAIRIVATNGIHGAPTAQIAAQADVAEITLFRHFKTKDELLNEVFHVCLGRVQQQMRDNHDETQAVELRFADLARKIITFFQENTYELSFMEQYLHSPLGWGNRPDMKFESGCSFDEYPLIHLLETGQSRGEIKQLPMPALTGLIVGTIASYIREQKLKGVHYDESVNEAVIRACWDGVKT